MLNSPYGQTLGCPTKMQQQFDVLLELKSVLALDANTVICGPFQKKTIATSILKGADILRRQLSNCLQHLLQQGLEFAKSRGRHDYRVASAV